VAKKRASRSLDGRWRFAREAGWLRGRSDRSPSSGELLAVAAWMLVAVALLDALIFLLGLIDTPRAVLIVPVAMTLVYVGRQAHYVFWPLTVRLNVPWAAVVPAVVGLVGVSLLVGLLLNLLGLLIAVVVSVYGLLLVVYNLTWQWRWIQAASPGIRPVRYVLWVLMFVVVGLLAAYYGVHVNGGQVQAFYSTMAQVDAAVLIAAAFQQLRWAQDSRSLEAFVILTGSALAVSLTCSLWAVARGTDTAPLFMLAIVGSATGLVFVGLAVIMNTAPDLLENWRPGRHEGARSSVDDGHPPEAGR
jgi:hypothetical protein